MRRAEYLAEPAVADFLNWIRPLVEGRRALVHAWIGGRGEAFGCTSLFEAFGQYQWPFRITLPGHYSETVGRSFAETEFVLGQLSIELQRAAADRNSERFTDYAIAVLKWGGVTKANVPWLTSRSSREVLDVIDAADLLDPEKADLAQLAGIPRLNSGFTKIYALMLRGSVIYDSRVGAALTYLIAQYMREAALTYTPTPLRLRLPTGYQRGGLPYRRVPGFTTLGSSPAAWADSNIRASWLLGEAARHGEFSSFEPAQRLRAIESACFMLGYSLSGMSVGS